MSPDNLTRCVTLYKREGSADKVYQLTLRQVDAGQFEVVFENARRGQALKLAKHLTGLTAEQAQAALDKQLQAKLKDGYTEHESGASYTSSAFAGRDSGVRPQLPNPVAESDVRGLLADPSWGMQEKANGENRTLLVDADGVAQGANKKGLIVAIPQAWQAQLQAAGAANAVLCGEHVGEIYHAYDALALDGQDLKHLPFRDRYARLAQAIAAWAAPDLRLLTCHTSSEAKTAVLTLLRQDNQEGVVFKRLDAAHTDGYSDAALKFKFYESSACVVLAKNQQRSVQLGLYADGSLIPVGNVTIPANHAVPEAGEVVEVQYLYYNPGGAFEQPVYLFKRNDMAPLECTLDQVSRVKPEPTDAGAGESAPRERVAG